jgi:phage terminase large subunit-like protein
MGLVCPPRWASPRSPDRLTLGPRVAEVAAQLGVPLMPWQRYVADVALEIDPETGRLAYREVILTVPRQSGKSTLILTLGTHRALGFGERQVIRYGAQTRNDARQKWEDDYVEALEASPLRRLFKVRKTNGNEAIIWNNRSRWGITANTEKAGHGGTLDLAFLDEAFSQVDDRLEQAFKPAMITRQNAQFWVVSTAGTDTSVYLKAKRDRGRALVESGATKRVAYFEWSAPDDADPGDRRVWRSCMPALRCNGGIIDEDAIEADFNTMKLVEFQRAYLNQWPDRNVVDPVIPEQVWRDRADLDSRLGGQLVLALDASPGGRSAAIASSGRRSDGRLHMKVVDYQPGTAWVVDRMVELRDRWQPKKVLLDPAGPAGALLADLLAAGLEVEPVTGREMAQACGALLNDLTEDRVRHCDQDALNDAAGEATSRPSGDAWVWARRDTTADICPLVAVTVAAHGFRLYGSQEEVIPWAAWV